MRVAEGRVSRPDDTGEPRPVAGAWVVLHRVGSDRAGPLDSVRTGANGAFRFRYRLSGSPEALYFVSVQYRGIAYFSPPLRRAVVRGGDADVLVYDTTEDTTRLRVQGRHVIVSSTRGSTREVVEVFEIENRGPRTVVARDSTTPLWATALPADAESAAVAPGDVSAGAFTFRPGRAELFAAIPPGVRQVVLTYTLASHRFPVSVPVERETSVLEVLLEDPRGTARAPGLAEVGPATIEGRTFRRFLGRDVPRTAVLVVDVPAPPADRGRVIVALLIGLAAVMIVALAYWFARQRASAPTPAEPSSALIARLASLDAAFEKAQPASDESRARYERERAELKQRVRDALAAEERRG